MRSEIEASKENLKERFSRKFKVFIKKYLKINKYKIHNKIEVKIPMKFMNVGVTVGNFLIADTNDSNNWDTLKFPLPKPKFKWHKVSTRLNDNTIELYDKR